MLDRSSPIRHARLRKHADYQCVYRESRKYSSASMAYFFAPRSSHPAEGPRVGVTAGRALGKAVDRNRIKRRMREAIRSNLGALTRDVDVVLHPRRAVLTADFALLREEILAIFSRIQRSPTQRFPSKAGGSASHSAKRQEAQQR